MYRHSWLACGLLLTSAAWGQAPPGPKAAPPSPGFLIEALNHASPAIRLRAAQLLADEKIDAVPRLVETVTQADDLLAVRAGVVLIDRLDHLRRAPTPGKGGGPPQLTLQPQEREQVRRLISVVSQPQTHPWRFYLAIYVLDKLDPGSLPELLPALRFALRPDESPMKQYAAVQALYRLEAVGRAAEQELWMLLASHPCFRGLYVAKRALDDDMVAYTDEIGVYDLLFGLQTSYVISDLFVLETLRRMGAPEDRLTGALAHLAHHESQDVRLDVARQLGMLGGPAKQIAAEVLIGLLQEPSSLLRNHLSDEKEDAREEAIRLFTILGPAAARTVPALAELLAARENRARLSAATILGRIGPAAAAALPALRRALQFEQLRDGDDFQVIAAAIDRITGKAKDKPDSKR